MIHTLLNLTRPLIVFDTETTGLTNDARIIELGFQKWTSEGLVREHRTLINPGIPIPPAATAKHHITDTMIAACQTCGGDLPCGCESPKIAPYFKQIAKSLASGFSECDFAGKNIRFDLRRVTFEMERAGVPWSYAWARIIDGDRLEALALPRSLSHLYKKYTGEELEGAHSALVDVRATTTVIVEQLKTYPEVLPYDLDKLHELSWPGWLTACGSFKLVDGEARITFGKHREQLMKNVPRTYWDWILSNNFPPDVKKLAADAKLGKFPGDAVEEVLYAPLRIVEGEEPDGR